MTEWDWVTLVAGVVGLTGATVFLVGYLRRAGLDAWRSPFGRYLIIRKFLFAGLFLAVILNRLADHTAWWRATQEPAMALLISAIAASVFWPYRLLLKAQEEAQNKEAQR